VLAAADHSESGIVTDVPTAVHDRPDYEDNLTLDLAAEVGAPIVVSNDADRGLRRH
jgi:predicted nucleic acid-binding protein